MNVGRKDTAWLEHGTSPLPDDVSCLHIAAKDIPHAARMIQRVADALPSGLAVSFEGQAPLHLDEAFREMARELFAERPAIFLHLLPCDGARDIILALLENSSTLSCSSGARTAFPTGPLHEFFLDQQNLMAGKMPEEMVISRLAEYSRLLQMGAAHW